MEYIRRHLLHFPMTQCMVCLFTLIIAFVTVRDYTYGALEPLKAYTGILLTLFFVMGMGCFVSESVFDLISHKKQRLIGYVLSLIPAVSFAIAAYLSGSSVSQTNPMGMIRLISVWFPRYLICYGIITFSLGIFFCFRRGTVPFEKYVVRTFASIAKHSIIYFLLTLGVTLVLGILITLFPIKSAWNLLATVNCLLFGGYYVCAIFNSFMPGDKAESVFTEFLIKYILTGLITCAFAIIYLYILKIIITWNMPSNQVFGILSWLFLIGAPIWTMANSYHEKNPLRQISRYFPYLFLPFILLQCYSVGVRILENGLTPSRYLGVILILFEIAYLMFYRFCRCKIPYLLCMICGFCAISCIMPGINMYTASFMTQKLALESYLTEASDALSTDASDRKFARAQGAYDYLKWEASEGENYLDEITQDERYAKKLASLVESGTAKPSAVCTLVRTRKEVNRFDVEGYSSCQKIEYHSYRYPDSEFEPICGLSNASSYTFTDDNSDTQFTLNLKELCTPYLALMDSLQDNADSELEVKADDFFLSHNILDLENGDRLILTRLEMDDYNKEDDSLGEIVLEGYLLER